MANGTIDTKWKITPTVVTATGAGETIQQINLNTAGKFVDRDILVTTTVDIPAATPQVNANVISVPEGG